MVKFLTIGMIAILALSGCAQPEAPINTRRCKTKECLAAKKAILAKKTAGPTPDPDPPKTEEPKEVVDKVAADRKYFQTRSVITLRPLDNILASGDEYSLINATSKKTLIERQAAGPTLSLDDAAVQYRLGGASDNFTLQLYPGLSDDGQFNYGANSLRLWIKTPADDQKYSLIDVYLSDFDMMGLTQSTLPSSSDTSNEFEGWVNTLSAPVVASDTSKLTVEFPNIVND